MEPSSSRQKVISVMMGRDGTGNSSRPMRILRQQRLPVVNSNRIIRVVQNLPPLIDSPSMRGRSSPRVLSASRTSGGRKPTISGIRAFGIQKASTSTAPTSSLSLITNDDKANERDDRKAWIAIRLAEIVAERDLSYEMDADRIRQIENGLRSQYLDQLIQNRRVALIGTRTMSAVETVTLDGPMEGSSTSNGILNAVTKIDEESFPPVIDINDDDEMKTEERLDSNFHYRMPRLSHYKTRENGHLAPFTGMDTIGHKAYGLGVPGHYYVTGLAPRAPRGRPGRPRREFQAMRFQQFYDYHNRNPARLTFNPADYIDDDEEDESAVVDVENDEDNLPFVSKQPKSAIDFFRDSSTDSLHNGKNDLPGNITYQRRFDGRRMVLRCEQAPGMAKRPRAYQGYRAIARSIKTNAYQRQQMTQIHSVPLPQAAELETKEIDLKKMNGDDELVMNGIGVVAAEEEDENEEKRIKEEPLDDENPDCEAAEPLPKAKETPQIDNKTRSTALSQRKNEPDAKAFVRLNRNFMACRLAESRADLQREMNFYKRLLDRWDTVDHTNALTVKEEEESNGEQFNPDETYQTDDDDLPDYDESVH